LNGKCFLLTNFSNDKQTQENLKSEFSKSEFQETNIALGLIGRVVVIVVVFQSVFYVKMYQNIIFKKLFLKTMY